MVSVGFTAGLIGIEHEFSWQTNAPLQGMNFVQAKGGWLLVVKTTSKRRGALVAFFGGGTPEDAFTYMLEVISTKEGIKWKEDKWKKPK